MFQYSWRRPEVGISSIDENSITDSESFRHVGRFSSSPYHNDMNHPKMHHQLHPNQDNLSSTNYLAAQSYTAITNHSPPYSDLNPISLPYLGTSMPARPVRIM